MIKHVPIFLLCIVIFGITLSGLGIYFTPTILYKMHLDHAQRFYNANEFSRACVDSEMAVDFAIMGDVDPADLLKAQSLKKEYCGRVG